MKATNRKPKTSDDYVLLAASQKAAPMATPIDTLNANETMSVTARFRRKKSIDPVLKSAKRLSHQEYEDSDGATAGDLTAVEAFAQEHHLTVVESSPVRRSVVLTGSVKNFEAAFQVHLSHYRTAEGITFRGRTGGMVSRRLIFGLGLERSSLACSARKTGKTIERP